jgi:membrane protease YdiL (CAAX protease family)
MVATLAALIARSWLQLRLLRDGMPPSVTADVSFLIVPPILLLLLFPLWKSEKQFLANLFRRWDLTWRLALNALAIGVLIRLTFWCQLIAGVSFGVYQSVDPEANVGPVFSFQCESPSVVVLGFVVMAVLVPLIEEVTNRGYFQTALQRRGAVFAVLVSALIFTVFHRIGSWPFVFFCGLLLGTQFWVTRSLWASLISHATINGLAQLDWRCLSGQWNPRIDDIPVWTPGIVSITALFACLFGIVFLLRKIATEAKHRPGSDSSQCVRHPLEHV